MTNQSEISKSVKWRESTYNFIRLDDDGKVHWRNPVSRHEASCSVEAWKRSDPYDKANT